MGTSLRFSLLSRFAFNAILIQVGVAKQIQRNFFTSTSLLPTIFSISLTHSLALSLSLSIVVGCCFLLMLFLFFLDDVVVDIFFSTPSSSSSSYKQSQ